MRKYFAKANCDLPEVAGVAPSLLNQGLGLVRPAGRFHKLCRRAEMFNVFPGWGTGGLQVLSYAALFLIIALVAAFFGFGGIAASAAGIAQVLFWLFLSYSLLVSSWDGAEIRGGGGKLPWSMTSEAGPLPAGIQRTDESVLGWIPARLVLGASRRFATLLLDEQIQTEFECSLSHRRDDSVSGAQRCA